MVAMEVSQMMDAYMFLTVRHILTVVCSISFKSSRTRLYFFAAAMQILHRRHLRPGQMALVLYSGVQAVKIIEQ